jgi:hypothetical protein
LLGFEQDTQIAALNGQSWSLSCYVKIISGTANSFSLNWSERNSSAGFLVGAVVTIAPTSTLQRFTLSGTLTGGATVAAVQPFIRAVVTNGASYDFTIRIAAPQMELGDYATTFIPTTTAAVTRIADDASKTGVSSLIGQNSGTLFVEWDNSNKSLVNLIETYNNASGLTGTSSIILQKSGNSQFNIRVFDSLNNYSDTFSATIPSGTNKVALAYQPGSATLYLNGSLVGSNTRTYVFVSTRDAMAFDNRAPYPRAQAALFKTRLTNAQLAAITTL